MYSATTTRAITCIATAQALDGKVVDWMEQVSGEQSNKARKR